MAIKLSAAVWSGVAAGILSSLAQVLVWATFTDQFPGALLRDAHLTAAIVLGRAVLPPPADFDVTVMMLAGTIHFALSIAYGVALAWLVSGRGMPRVLLIGGGFGLALYAVNLYGFTLIFPWFAQVRDANTLMAHIVFGVTGAGAYRLLAAERRPRS